MREYSLLMVDDELFAVRGITEGISWEEFGITKVYGVCNVKEAKTILERERIDVVISDIEMPGGKRSGSAYLGFRELSRNKDAASDSLCQI